MAARQKSGGSAMSKAGQSSGTGACTELNDEEVRKDDILSNRDKAQRRPGQSLDSKGVQVDEYKDNPANRRPPADESKEAESREASGGTAVPSTDKDQDARAEDPAKE